MNPTDETPTSPLPSDPPPSAPRAASPAPAPLPPVPPAMTAALPAGLESGLERLAREVLQQQRDERRWRVFFRLAWLGLAIAVAWAVFAQRNHAATSTKPHTALVELRGEIAADTEASAEQ